MALETGTYISDLVATNPTASDAKSQGDDHIRLLKSTVKATFPNVTGAVTATHTQLNTVPNLAPIASPTFTGFPAAPTATLGTSTTQLATTAFVQAAALAASGVPDQAGHAGKSLTTDGSSASWSFTNSPYLKVSDQKASGTGGGTSLAADITQVRTLNTVDTNTISGASLASNTITLPAGTYTYRIRAPHYTGTNHKAFLYNSTDASYAGIGTSEYSISGATTGTTSSIVSGQFTIAATKDFKVRHYTTTGAGAGLGVATSSGQVEVYTVAEFWRVA